MLIKFTGAGRDDRRLLTCPECESAKFKIVKLGASDLPRVECANCECVMSEVKIDV